MADESRFFITILNYGFWNTVSVLYTGRPGITRSTDNPIIFVISYYDMIIYYLSTALFSYECFFSGFILSRFYLLCFGVFVWVSDCLCKDEIHFIVSFIRLFSFLCENEIIYFDAILCIHQIKKFVCAFSLIFLSATLWSLQLCILIINS